jgi:hypothetical protein
LNVFLMYLALEEIYYHSIDDQVTWCQVCQDVWEPSLAVVVRLSVCCIVYQFYSHAAYSYSC